MRPSRGMGAIKKDKIPGGKIIRRKDNPQFVEVFKKGGIVKQLKK